MVFEHSRDVHHGLPISCIPGRGGAVAASLSQNRGVFCMMQTEVKLLELGAMPTTITGLLLSRFHCVLQCESGSSCAFVQEDPIYIGIR